MSCRFFSQLVVCSAPRDGSRALTDDSGEDSLGDSPDIESTLTDVIAVFKIVDLRELQTNVVAIGCRL